MPWTWPTPWRGLGRDPLTLGVLLLVLSAVVSTACSRAPWVSLQGASESYLGAPTVLAYAVLFLATRRLCASLDDARRLALAPVLAAGVAGTYAVVQLAGLDPVLYARTAGLAGVVRPFATMGHPNFLAAFLAATMPLVVVAVLRALRARRPVAAGAFAVAGALAGVAIVVAASRGAWLALAAAMAVLLAGALRQGDRRATGLVAGIAGGSAVTLGVLVLALPAGTLLAERVRTLADVANRRHIWRAAWRLFREHPIAGTGLDTFQIAFADQRTAAYWAVEWNGSPTRAHNEALNLLATQGLLGGLAALVLAAGVLLAARHALRRCEDRLLVLALTAGVTAFVVQDLFSFTVAGCGTLVVTQVALLSRLARGDEGAGGRDGSTALAATLGVGTLLALAALGHNLVADVLLEAPGRLAGAGLVLLALVASAAAALAVEWGPARPPADDGPPEAGRGRLTLRWALAVALLLLLVARPLAASRQAALGIRLTPVDAAAALPPLRQAVALEPFTELYRVKLGSAAQAAARATRDAGERGRLLEESRAAYAQAIGLVPGNAYNHANLGRALADLARDGRATPAEAFARFERALALDPNNAYLYTDAAGAAMLLGDLDRAGDYARRAIARYPRFAVPRAQLGHVALARGETREAAEMLGAAVAGEWHGAPGRAGAASNLAAALLRLDRPAEAAAAARLALSLWPTSVEARFNLGQSLERLGRRAEAIVEYRRLPDFEPARAALRALEAS